MKIIPSTITANLTHEDLEEMLTFFHLYRKLLDRHPDWWNRRHLTAMPITLSRGDFSCQLWLLAISQQLEEGTLTLHTRAGSHNRAIQLFDIPTSVKVDKEMDVVVRLTSAIAVEGANIVGGTALLLCENDTWRPHDPPNFLFTGIE